MAVTRHQAEPCPPEERLGKTIIRRYYLMNVISKSKNATVYSAIDIRTSIYYAVKVLNKIGTDQRQLEHQKQEVLLHQLVSRHPNVVSLHRYVDCVDCTFLILEYVPDGDLYINISHGLFVGNDFFIRQIFLEILDAVGYCHSRQVYHRDLKPENILVADGGLAIKLTDFGLSTTEGLSTDFGVGSFSYASPESQQVRAGSGYASAPSDVWSLGVILVNLTCGRNPWHRASLDDELFSAYLKDANFLKENLPISLELAVILRYIFECDPTKRITLPRLRELIAHCPRFSIWTHQEELW